MSSERKTVLIIGGAGHIGRAFVRFYADRYDLKLLDRRAIEESPAGAEIVAADIDDIDRLQEAMDNTDAVVHLAGDPSVFATWDSVLKYNINGAYNVFEAARRAGVRKVVYASSGHASVMHVKEFGIVGPDAPVRPDSLYGASKAAGEAIGRYYSDVQGMSVVCLRIGACQGSDDPDRQKERLRRWLGHERQFPYSAAWQNIAMWISNRDVAQLIERSIESDLRFGVFYGASDNEPGIFDLADTKRLLGYAPQDSVQALLGDEYRLASQST